MRRKLLAAISGLAIVAGSSARARASDAPVTVVGDSLSIGLATALREMCPYLPLVSLGVVSSGLSNPRLVDWQARIRAVVAARPARVLVMLGMNDSGTAPTADYIANLISFLTPMTEATVPFAVISIPQTDDPVRNRNIACLNTIYERTCVRYGGRFIRLPSFDRAKRSPDGVHFTRGGYRELAASVLSEWRGRV